MTSARDARESPRHGFKFLERAMSELTLALFQPDIPQNAGTMLRACACLGVNAAIIEPAGFPISDRHFRRAGMDYLDELTIDPLLQPPVARHSYYSNDATGWGPQPLL
jgi:hypothetical protein